MIDDVRDLLGMQPRVYRMTDGAHSGNAVIEFEMAVAVPGDRADTVAVGYPECAKRVCELCGTRFGIAIGVAVDRAFDGARNDLDIAVEPGRVLDDRAEHQWGIHHQAAHWLSLFGSGNVNGL